MGMLQGAFLAIGQAVAVVGQKIGAFVFNAGAEFANILTHLGVEKGAAIAAGLGAANLGFAALNGALSFGLSALISPSHGAGGDPIDYKADPNLPAPIIMGRTASGGYQVHLSTSTEGADNEFLHHFIVHSGGGPVNSFEAFYADSGAVTFDGSYNAIGTPYEDYMFLKNDTGAQPSSYISAPSGTGTIPEWTSAHAMSGWASSRWVLGWKSNRYQFGPPKPLWVIEGVALYDPREDSGLSGGSGSQDYSDQTTWTYAENPACGAISWCIGYKHNDILTFGLGASIDQIDYTAFQEAAEVCEDNGWTFGGVLTTADSKWENLVAICQAGGMIPIRSGALLSVIVQTPRVSIETITGADLVGEISIAGTVRRKDRINSVNYQWRDETLDWATKISGPISVSAFVTEDGGTRTRAISYPLVQDGDQGAQLAAYAIYDARERTPIVFTVKPYLAGLKPGDVITLNEPELGMDEQDLLILSRQRDPSTGLPTLTCRTENPDKHAAALAFTAP